MNLASNIVLVYKMYKHLHYWVRSFLQVQLSYSYHLHNNADAIYVARSLREIINWNNVLYNAWWDGKTHLEVVPWDTWLGVGLVGWEEWLTVFEHMGIP